MSLSILLVRPAPFTVITDHKPLVGLFEKPLSEVPNARLQRLRLRTEGYHFNLQWQAGKLNVAADALSRAPVFGPAPLAAEDAQEAAAFARAVRDDAGLRVLLDAARADEYQSVLAAVRGAVRSRWAPVRSPRSAASRRLALVEYQGRGRRCPCRLRRPSHFGSLGRPRRGSRGATQVTRQHG
jgi:hypothetical protein